MCDEFSREVLKHAAARACIALDYKQAHSSVLDCLADILAHYIESIGEKIHDHAELAGRAVPGTHDCISSLETFKVATKTPYQELNIFAFGGKSDNRNSNATWNQPFPVHIPQFPTAPQSKNITSLTLSSINTTSDKRLPGRSFSHLPSFPPSRTYSKIPMNDSKTSNDTTSSASKKRKAENDSEETSSTLLREKKITSAKNIQKTLTRLDSLTNTSETSFNTSIQEDNHQSKNNSLSTTTILHQGPSLSILNSTNSSSTTQLSSTGSSLPTNSNSRRVVLDENCDVLKGLSKEERLLMGLPTTHHGVDRDESNNPGGNISSSGPGPKQHYHHSLDEKAE